MENKKFLNNSVKTNDVSFDFALGLVGNTKNIDGVQAVVNHQVAYLGRVGAFLLDELDSNGYYLDQNNKVCRKVAE